jgi:hypothetical protein
MSRKSSTFIKETRDRETWLGSVLERETQEPAEQEQLLATAALTRGMLQSIAVPEEAEERSRAQAVAYMQELHLNRLGSTRAEAPWYLRLGRFMRYVFTLGRWR